MELYPGVANGGNVVPFPEGNARRVGSENPNTEEVVEPDLFDMYDINSFLQDGIVDDVFPEFREMLQAVPPPPPRRIPPQHPRQSIILVPRDTGSIKWTKELHASFVDAVKQLGGAFIATPKTVLDIMDVQGLNLRQVKSHLQKYRRGKRFLNDLKKSYKRGSSFSRALGVPRKPAPSPRPRRGKKCRRKTKKQEHESLHVNIMFQNHLHHLLEVQRQYGRGEAIMMASNQKMVGYPIASNQDFGGHVFAANQGTGGYASSGWKTFPENNFILEATIAPVTGFPSYQLNQYSGCASAATAHAGIFMAQKPDELSSIPAAHPYQLTQASNHSDAASGTYQQGSSSDSGESSGAVGMSDEEFVESFLVDYDELIGDSPDTQ